MKKIVLSLYCFVFFTGCIKDASDSKNSIETIDFKGKWEKNHSYCNNTEIDTVLIDTNSIFYYTNCFNKKKYHFKFINSSTIEFEDTEYGWNYNPYTHKYLYSSFKITSKDEFSVINMIENDAQLGDSSKRQLVKFKRLP